MSITKIVSPKNLALAAELIKCHFDKTAEKMRMECEQKFDLKENKGIDEVERHTLERLEAKLKHEGYLPSEP